MININKKRSIVVFASILVAILMVVIVIMSSSLNPEKNYSLDTESGNVPYSINQSISSDSSNDVVTEEIPNADVAEQAIEEIKEGITDEEIDAFLELDKTEIQEEYEEILAEYDVGEQFSEEDSEFIIMLSEISELKAKGAFTVDSEEPNSELASVSNQPALIELGTADIEKNVNATKAIYTETRNTGNRIKVFSKKQGVQIEFDWFIKVTVPIVGDSSYRGKLEAIPLSGRGNVKSINLTTYHTCIGLVGKWPGLVYSGSKSSGAKTDSPWKSDLTKKYFAVLPILTTSHAEAFVKTKEGSYNCLTPTYTWIW